MLLIAFPLSAEVYQWVNPTIAPAAAQRATQTDTPSTPGSTPNPTNTTGPTITSSPTRTSGPSPTTGPTNTAGPTLTTGPTPTTNPNEPPLSVDKIASLASATVGQQFSYSISVFTNSPSPRTVIVQDSINPQLTIV